MKNSTLLSIVFVAVILFSSCQSSPDKKTASEHAPTDTVSVSAYDTLASGAEVDYATGVEEPAYALEETPVPNNEVQAILPTATPTADTIVTYGITRSTKPKGSMVYYCPTRMLENTDNNVSVTITKAAMKEAIDQLGKRVSATTGTSAEAILRNITGSSITMASKMKVELKYADKDFQTIYKPENEDQFFDGENDMHWDWIIKPTKVGPVQLSIIVSAFDEKNGRWIPVQTPPKIFDIKVQVDPRGYFSKLWGFFGDHPEWLLTQLLFPLAAFFYGKRQKAKAV